MKKRRTVEEVKELLTSYRQRGEMTRRQFCEAQGMSQATLDYYLRRYTPTKVGLAEVRLQSREETGDGIRFALVLENGRRIECNEAGLPALVRIAEAG